jgi:DNA-binding transcriptional LysR family regulator
MKLHLDTITLEMFIAIADTKSFSMASQIVGRTQPAVSLQIKKLEVQLGCKLLERSGSKINLTTNGEIFLSFATGVIKSQLELQSVLSNKNLKQFKLRVGMPEDIAAIYLGNILKSLHKLYPDLDLTINCDLTLNILQSFNNGEYDIAIIKDDQDFSKIYSNHVEIWIEPLLWIADENYTIKDKASLIVSPEPCIYRAKAINILSKNGIPWNIQYTTHSLAGKVAALNACFGICALPSRILEQHKSFRDVGRKFNLPELGNFKISMLKNNQSDKELLDMFAQHVVSGLSC